MLQRIVYICFCLAIGFALLIPKPLFAKSVRSYKALVKQLAAGNSKQEEVIDDVIKAAQSFVTSQQSRKRAVDIRFEKPIDLVLLSSDYVSVSFDAREDKLTHKEKIIFALLFESQGKGKIKFSNYYLSWSGKKNIYSFKKISVNELCKEYENITGISPCISRRATSKEGKPGVSKSEIITLDNKLNKKASIKHTHSGVDITSGKIKEQYIDDAITRDKELTGILKDIKQLQEKQNIQVKQGKKRLQEIEKQVQESKETQKKDQDIRKLEDHVGSLKKEIAELKGTVEKLTSLLKGISRKNNNIVFSGVNVQIVNGSGSTTKVNGKGNLIVGYNEKKGKAKRVGSHNIVVGPRHSYSSYGGIVSGDSNTIAGKFSNVTGGRGNTASGAYSSVSGGHINRATGSYSNVSGGLNRSASGENSWTGGDKSAMQ